MTFDCDKLKPKCKAMCCAPTPIPAELWDSLKHKAVRSVMEVKRFISPILTKEAIENPGNSENAEHVIAISEVDPEINSPRCPFLTQDLKCNIYEERPYVCREFGSESHLMMKCCFQDKDGRVRSRQEMRSVARCQCKAAEKLTALCEREESKNPKLRIVSLS